MKVCLVLALGFLGLYANSQDYLLADHDEEKFKIANIIQNGIHENRLKANPVVVVNHKVLKKGNLNTFDFYASEIIKIEIIEKDMPQMRDAYGVQGLNGVVLIETRNLDTLPQVNISDEKVLFLVDNQIYTRAEWYKLNPDNVKSITVIRDKKSIAKYTTDVSYDLVVEVILRKRN